MEDRADILPEFDDELYRSLHVDLAQMAVADAFAHYQAFGADEGRIASIGDTREGFIGSIIKNQNGDILEIGPFCAPVLRGPSVYYLDVLDADQLRVRAAEHGLSPDDCPSEIHFTRGLASIDRTFDAVFCSHAIEHQPDLIDHLQQIRRILKPGGNYYLIIPDKRYCFDALLGASSIADVIEAHSECRKVHTLGNVIEHSALTTHNDPVRHWQKDHGVIDPDQACERITRALEAYDSAEGGYIDTHAWQFTPKSFRQIISMLRTLDIIELDVAAVYNTPQGRLEFCAILTA